MDNKRDLSIRKIFSVAKTEYVKWICDPRMIIYVAMNIFMYDYVTKVLLQNAEKMGKPINIIEPFIAICNSPVLLFIIPLIFLGLISDFPKTDGNAMFYMIRTGKTNWLIGQVLFALMAGTSFVASIFVITCTCVAGNSYVFNQWSYVVRRYAVTFPDDTDNIMLELIPNRLYNNLTPLETLAHTFALMLMLMLFIAFIQLLGFTYNHKMTGLLVNIGLLSVGIGAQMFEGAFKWYFPVSNALAWMHYRELARERIVPMGNSYLYFAVSIVVLAVWSIIAIKKYDFSKVKDLED